jgi:hypothetical protein
MAQYLSSSPVVLDSQLANLRESKDYGGEYPEIIQDVATAHSPGSI